MNEIPLGSKIVIGAATISGVIAMIAGNFEQGLLLLIFANTERMISASERK